jgi:hypothetical protein
MNNIINTKPLFDQLDRKPKDKASAVFLKLLPKNKNLKPWVSILGDDYPIPDIKQLRE